MSAIVLVVHLHPVPQKMWASVASAECSRKLVVGGADEPVEEQ